VSTGGRPNLFAAKVRPDGASSWRSIIIVTAIIVIVVAVLVIWAALD
jgi:hypothetical protein